MSTATPVSNPEEKTFVHRKVIPGLIPHERRVMEMMAGFRQPVPSGPTMPDLKNRKLRTRLPMEEVFELADAFGLEVRVLGEFIESHFDVDKDETPSAAITFDDLEFVAVKPPNMEMIVDALSDCSVVIYGGFVACGIRAEPMLELTDANNLMKIANGKLDAHGKFQKSSSHPSPNYSLALQLQGWTEYFQRQAEAAFPGELLQQAQEMAADRQTSLASHGKAVAASPVETPAERELTAHDVFLWLNKHKDRVAIVSADDDVRTTFGLGEVIFHGDEDALLIKTSSLKGDELVMQYGDLEAVDKLPGLADGEYVIGGKYGDHVLQLFRNGRAAEVVHYVNAAAGIGTATNLLRVTDGRTPGPARLVVKVRG